MCGIAGVHRAGGVDTTPLARMVRSLTHRGPDEEGLGTYRPLGTAKDTCGMGVRRLAIVDPESGQQPASDAGGHIHVVLNGEIYNHHRLRTELEARGVAFASRSDTEVLANLIAHAGIESALNQLQGMFAFSAYDSRDGTLWVVRDRLGQKPLYWSLVEDGSLIWASELHSLREHPATDRWEVDPRAEFALLTWEYIPSPWTMWRGVHKLESGMMLEVRDGELEVKQWWQPPVPAAGRGGNLTRWARSVRGALEVATRRRVEADVEVGVLLSGGLDSSAIAALGQQSTDGSLQSFSVAVEAEGFNESGPAQLVAEHLGTRHHVAHLGAADLEPILGQIARHMSEPLADSSLVATWRLMELVNSTGLKCVLSGDGADESFAGYPTYLAHRLARVARPLAGPLASIAARLPTRTNGVTRDYMVRRFTGGLSLDWPSMHQMWMGAWTAQELNAPAALAELAGRHAQAASATDAVSRALYIDQRLYMSEGVLVKVDRASMAHGVEVRSPFLDHHLVELAASIPSHHKLQGRTGKVVLRRAVEDLVPRSTLERSKQGFGTPVGPWLRGPCSGLLDGLPDALAHRIAPDQLHRVIREHRDGNADHRRRLWSSLILAKWHEHHGPHR